MEQIFLRLVSMSLSAGWLVLAVVALRLLMRRAPRRIVCLLWALVALRLMCPAQLTWRASLVPSRQTVAQTAQTTLASPAEPAQTAETAPAEAGARLDLTQTLSRVWLAGVLVMLLWAAAGDVRLRLRLRAACRHEDNIWLCDGIDSPFVLGVVRPRIYLPPGLDAEPSAYVLAHERAHIARGDHIWKPLGWLLLSFYWFHPLLWLAYVLLCRDLELACDERVARGLDRAGIAAYAETLLSCGCRRYSVPVSPVAFGELGVKARVKAILRYRKPVFLRVALALAVVAATGAFFLTERPAVVAELTAAVVADGAAPAVLWSEPLPGDDFPPQSAPSAPAQPADAPAAASASATTASAATAQQTQSATDASADDAFAQMMEEYNAQIREEAAVRYGTNGSSSPLDTFSDPSRYTYPNTTMPQQPNPPLLVAGAGSSGNPNPNSNNVGATWNGNYPVISLTP